MINATGVIDMDTGTRQDNKVGPIIAEVQEEVHQININVVDQEVIQDTQNIQEIVIPEKIPTANIEEESIQEVDQEINVDRMINQRKDQGIDLTKGQEMVRERIQEEEVIETKIGQGKKNDHEKKTGQGNKIELGIRRTQERGKDQEIGQETISQDQEKGRMMRVEESIAEAHKEAIAGKDTAEMIT